MNVIIEKYKKMPEALKAGLWFVVCFVFQRGIQFIGMPIYTRLMSQEEFGIYSSFMSWSHVIVIISSLNIYASIFNKALIKYEDQKDQYISAIQTLTLIISIVFAGSILLFKPHLSGLMNLNETCLVLMAIYILVFPSIQYWSQRQRFSFKYKPIIVLTLFDSLFSLGLGIFFVLLSNHQKGIALIDATVLVQVVISLVLFLYLFWKGRCVYNKEYWLWSLGLAIPLLPHYLSEILLGHADRIMINTMCGSDKAAIYNVAYQISMVMTIIRTGLNGAYLPWEFKEIKSGDYESLKKTTNIYAIMMATMTVLCMLIGPELLMIAAPKSYYEAIYDIPAIMAGCFFIFEYVLFTNVEMYYEKKQYVAIASIVAAVVNLVLNYYCIMQWGYLAAGYTTAISYAIMVGMHFVFYTRMQKNNPEIKAFYNINLLFLLMLIVTCSGALALLLYTNSIIRYVVIVVVVVLIYIYRNKIRTLIRTIKR